MISSHTTAYGSNPEDGFEFNHSDPESQQVRCAHENCFRDAHSDSQSGECALHTLIGWEDELRRNQYDMEIQAEYASWVVRAGKEMG